MISHVNSVVHTCAACGAENQVEVWDIVDVDERSDLFQRVLDETLHEYSCRRCGATGYVDAPLLLLRQHADTALIISPSPASPPDRFADEVRQLLDVLRATAGPSWHDDWLERRATVMRQSLQTVIEDAWDDLISGDDDDSDALVQLVSGLFRIDDPTRVRSIIAEHPELLSDDAESIVASFILQFRNMGMRELENRGASLFALLDRLRRGESSDPEEPAATPAHRDQLRQLLSQVTPFRRPDEIPAQLEACERALALVDKATEPALWALIKTMIASRLAEDPTGNPRDNVERSIGAYEEVLDVVSPTENLSVWASALMGLVHTYQMRVVGNRGDNFDRAIALCRRGLDQITHEDHADSFAGLQDALGSAYLDHPAGDRVANVERALQAYNAALAVLNEPAQQQQRGVVLHNLGRAYRMRVRGTPSENIEYAIRAMEGARTLIPDAKESMASAVLSENLGVAYLERVQGDPDENIDRAIAAFHNALGVRARDVIPLEWATTTMNLGTAYADRALQDGGDNGAAIKCFERALQVLTRDMAPMQWAIANANLGLALSERASAADRDALRRALELSNQALEVLTPAVMPHECRRLATRVGQIYQTLGDERAAYDALHLAMDAADALYRSAFIPSSAELEARINAEVSDNLVRVCVALSDDPTFARRALVSAERGRARRFLDLMGHTPMPAPAGVPERLIRKEKKALEQLRAIDQALWGARLPDQEAQLLGESRQEMEDQLAQIWDSISAAAAAGRDYVSLRRGETVTWSDLIGLATTLGTGTALVEFYLLDRSVVSLVLRSEWDAPRVFTHVFPDGRPLAHYLAAYEHDILGAGGEPGHITHEWQLLGEALFGPILPALEGVETIYLIPHGSLHGLPLHALTLRGTPLIEHHPVVYAPSAGVLMHTLARRPPESEVGGNALVLGYTAGTDPIERQLFLGEAKTVAKRLAAEPLLDAAASMQALRQRAPAARQIHLSCHGVFDPDDPLDSAIALADGRFTARDWMTLSLQADLATVSACETGVTRVGPGDDIVGMTTALLYAGASTTLVTLWSVAAETTAEWMDDFYRRRSTDPSETTSKADAFQQATLRLRERYADPFFWGPFTLVGDGR